MDQTKLSADDFRRNLEAAVGDENVSRDYTEIPSIHRATYADVAENEPLLKKSKLVVRPSSAESVCRVVALAAQNRSPVVPMGGATGLFVSGGAVPEADGSVVIDMRLMNKAIDLDLKNRTVTVEAGITIQQLNDYLKPYGLWFPHHPESYSSATVGGAISTNGISPFSTKYGRPNNQVAGVKVVLPNGRICEIGNKSKLDNALHLRDVILSSEGTLGVIVEATLKTYAIPEARIRRVFGFDEIADACLAIRNVVDAGLIPEVVMIPSRERIYNEALLPLLSTIDVSAILGESKAFVLAAHAGDKSHAQWSMEETQRIMNAANGRLIEDQRVVDSYWANLTEIGAVLTPQMAAAYKGHKYNSTRNGIPLGAFPEFAARERLAVAAMGKLIDAGITAYVLLPELEAIPICGALMVDTDRERVSEFNDLLATVSELSKLLGGSVCSAAGMGTQFREYIELELGSSKEIWDAIKRALDPSCIMNPGKLA